MAEKYSLRRSFPSLGIAVTACLRDIEVLNGRRGGLLFESRIRHRRHMDSVSNKFSLEAWVRRNISRDLSALLPCNVEHVPSAVEDYELV